MRALLTLLVVLSVFCGAFDVAGELRPGGSVPVRLLYDNSGSMYPGYRPGAPRRRPELNVRYIHEYPEFQQWLADFVRLQTVLGGSSVEMTTFTSDEVFTPRDLQQVHRPVAAAQFSVTEAVRNFPQRRGRTTHLVDSLRTFTHGYTGIVWLITDNVVETAAGVPDRGVDEFFEMLDSDDRFRSVHLFKLPFADPAAGQQSTLAVYGLVVSPHPVASETLAWYDRKFRENLRFANRSAGNPPPQLFPGREHLKLKNLEVDALELIANTNLKLLIEDPDRGMFKEGQNIRLQLSGDIQSYLTQHSVTAGRYRLQLAAPFAPEANAQTEFGLRALAPDDFEEVSDAIRQPIPPNGRRNVAALLQSAQPVSFSPDGFGAWVRLALSGATVRYTGTVRMSFEDVAVRLEPARMEGIFGIDRAPAIFELQNVRRLDNVQPSTAQVGFTLTAKANRSLVLLLILASLAAVTGIGAYLLSRKQWYRIRTSGSAEQIVALRRLGHYAIRHQDKPAGTLSRNLLGDYGFRPAAGATLGGPADGPWHIRFRDGTSCEISIDPVGGKQRSAPQKTAFPNPRPSSSRGPAPPVRPPLPKIDRP